MASSSPAMAMAMAMLITPSSPSLSPSLSFSQSQILTIPPKSTTKRSKSNLHYHSLRPNSINPEPHSPPSSPLSHLKPFLLSEWKPILCGWACSALSVSLLSLAVPSIAALPRVLSASSSPLRPLLKLAVLTTAQLMASYIQQALLWKAAMKAACMIRVEVFNRALLSDLEMFEGTGGVLTGDVAHRVTTECADVADMIFALLNTIVPTSLQLIAMSVQMISLSPILSVLSLSAIPFMSFIISYLGKRLNEISRESNLKTAQLSAYLNEDVGKAYNELKQGEPAVERLFHLTKFKSKVMENPNAINIEKVKGDIKFIGVKFKYGTDDVSNSNDNIINPLILNGINIHIKSGEKVAIVGPSGSGKSTLSKLLLRLYDPLCGSILLDGYDIRDIKLECLRKHISLVLQDTMLFCGTVAENIAYRVPTEQMDMVHVINAAKIANAHEFIESHSEKYETSIGSRGSLLSGGQKQRLAIARAVYQNSSVLVLDEATSALDSKSELLVRQALERLMLNRTVIIIAHRMETIEMADRVLILEQGKLREVEKSSFC
ncbi:hypothetical protein LUZ60_004151 [Juncus effusus]|nr:hypothetical protein LUZ60_004151 [Juncus effusus]